jgi:hypothetical protein
MGTDTLVSAMTARPPSFEWRRNGVDERFARLWIAHGGSNHGPHIECVSMPMASFQAFIQAVLSDGPTGQGKPVDDATGAIGDRRDEPLTSTSREEGLREP